MACYIKRNKSGVITDVNLPDGKTPSKLYYQILQNIQEGLPSLYASSVVNSLEENYVGKYINNTTDPEELALGIYLTVYDKKFKQFYGEWTQEPVLDKDEMIENSRGDKKSIYEFTSQVPPVQTRFRSARTKSTKRLMKQVELTVRELRDRINLAVQAREKSKLNKEYTKDQKIERERYYNNVIKKLNQQIETLTKNNQIEYVIAQGLSDMNMVRGILSGPVVNFTEVRFADDIIKAWKNINKILGINTFEDVVEPELRERVEKIMSEVNLSEIKLSNIARKLIVEAYNNSMPEDRKITTKDLDAFKDVSYIHSMARDITTVDNQTVGYLAKIINEANLKISKEHNRNYEDIETAFDKIKDNAEIKARGFDIFIKEQTNKLGMSTLGLRGRFSQAYYDAIRFQSKQLRINLEKAGDDKEAVKLAYRSYNSWIASNTILFNSAPFINAKNHTDDDRVNVINDLKTQGFTEDEIADMITQATKRAKKFEEDSEIYKTRLYLDIFSGDIILEEGEDQDAFVEERVKEWRQLNDPIAFIENANRNTLNTAEFKAFKGGRYSVKFPRKTVEGKDPGYYDENFGKIASDKALYGFYTFFRDFIQEQLNYLPEEEIDELQSNFLPVIVERMAKEYGFTALKESTKNMGDWFFKQLTIVDYDKSAKKDPITEAERQEFKPRFINEEVPTEERSKDLVLMMKLFSDMALVYKHKIQIQDQVDSINDLIQMADATIIEDKFGEKVESGKAPKNLQTMVGSAVLRSFYQIPPEAEGIGKKRRFYNIWEVLTLGGAKSEQYKKAKELQDKIEKLTKALESDELKEDDRAKLEKELYSSKSEYYKLGGRNLSMSSTIDALNRLTRQKGLAFNPFSALRNLAIGGINNIIHAYGAQDFTLQDYGKATNIIRASSAKYISWGTLQSESAEKILKINLDSKVVDNQDDVFKDAILGGINKASNWEKIKKYIPNPMTLMRSTDYLFKSQTSVAMLLGTKVETSKGTFNLFDVMNKNLEFDSEKYGEWLDEKNNGLSFEDFYDKTSAKIGQVAKKLHGFSGGGQSLAGKDSYIGRALFVFKTWLPETVAARFEKRKYDPILERHTEGYYRTFANRLFGDEGIRVGGIFQDFYDAAIKSETSTLSEEEAANLRKLMMEMSVILTLYMTYLLLSSALDDDDEKWKKLLINQLSLLNRDLTYYINPFSFESLTTNVVPGMSTVTQAYTAVEASLNYLAGVEDEDGDLVFDGERTMLKITKALPYVNNVNRIIYYSGRMGDVR